MSELRPKLLVIAGPNGAGKTSITTQILKHEWQDGCEYINPDEIAQHEFGDWNSPEAVRKAAQIATERRETYLSDSQSLIFETVFSIEEKLTYLERAKAAGFFIRLFFVGTDHPAINASRIARRVMEGGHDVPITKIISRYSKSIINCCLAASLVDRLYIYDNSRDFETAQLLFRASEGKVEKVYCEINDWAKPIFESLGL
jgi:predicted ABC-type ATPase